VCHFDAVTRGSACGIAAQAGQAAQSQRVRAETYRWFIRGLGFGLGLLVVATLALGMANAMRVLVLIFIALVLAAGLEPSTEWLRNKMPIGRGASVLFVYALFFLVVVGILVLIVPAAIGQLSLVGSRLGPILQNTRQWADTVQPAFLGAAIAALLDAVQRATETSTVQPKPADLLAFGITVADAAISTVSVLTMVYFWLTGRARLQRFVLALLPEDRRGGVRDAWNDVEGRLGSWVRAQLILMGTVGLMTTIAYALIGLDGALLLGVLAALAEAIPLVGPALGAIPALLVAAMTGDLGKVALVAVVYLIIQLIEGNVLIPQVMRRTMAVPPFLVVAGILIGAAIGGLVGALLAVPVVAALLAVLERLQARESVVPAEPATPSEGLPQSDEPT
jgi:predicted PurR-regulated permease PerM